MKKGSITSEQQLQEKLLSLKAKREVYESLLIEQASSSLRPSSLVKTILHDIAKDKKTGIDILKIAASGFSGYLGAKTGPVGKGASIVSTLINVIGNIRKKKSGEKKD